MDLKEMEYFHTKYRVISNTLLSPDYILSRNTLIFFIISHCIASL